MDDTGALSEHDLTSLRRAAAMAHTVGGLTIRLCSGESTVATIVPTAGGHAQPARVPTMHPAGPTLDPCGFRMAVAKAWADHQAGRCVALVGDGGTGRGTLDVVWSIRPPGRLLGFGGVRAHCGGSMVWAMPSLLGAGELSDVLEHLDDAVEAKSPTLDRVEARLVRDELLDVSVVHIEAGPDCAPTLAPLLDEVLCRLIAASAASELVASLTASAA